MKRREYSIASSQKVTPNSVALLVVVVGWVDPKGRHRFGQCTKYLSELPIGAPITVSIKPSVMKLPAKSTQPLIMAGLGTGLAPFRAFVQYRAWQKLQGTEIGSVLLYMGSRHQREEYLYGEEWEAYQDSGVITLLGRAFSRDQPQKIYIQDRMRQSLDDIVQAYIREEGAFYLCGPTWPVPDVTEVLEEAIATNAMTHGKKVDSRKEIEKLKEELRYVLEGSLLQMLMAERVLTSYPSLLREFFIFHLALQIRFKRFLYLVW
jgi:sulfite reductase (NADPH) flavoprotein alpha-component